MSKKESNFLVQGSILAIASIATRIIGLVYKIPLTRLIGQEAMTYYGTAHEIYNIALILSSLSIPLAVSKLISAKEQRKEYKNSARIVMVSLIIAIITGGAASLFLYFGADYLAVKNTYPSAAYPIRIIAPTLFIVAIMGVLRGLFQGHKNMVPTAISQIIEQLVNAVVSLTAAYYITKKYIDDPQLAAHSATGGTWGVFAGALIGLLFLLFVVYYNRNTLKNHPLHDISGNLDSYSLITKSIIITLFPIILSQLIYQISGIIDLNIYGAVMEKHGLDETARAIAYEGYNNKYRQLTNVPIAIAAALSATIVPTLSAAKAVNDIENVKRKIASSIKFNMIIAIPAAFGMSILGKQIIIMLYNDTSKVNGELMQLGSIAIIFFAYSTMTNGILQGINKLRTPVIHAAISLMLHIGFLYIMLNYLNLNTYALVIGNVTFALVISILNSIKIKSILGYKQEVMRTFIIPIIASVIMSLVTLLVYKLLSTFIGNTVNTIICIVVAVIVYSVSLIMLKGIDENELKSFPKGSYIIKLLKKCRLLKQD